MEVQFIVAEPTEKDAFDVLTWRNHPDTLAASNNSCPKVWPQFYEEFCNTYFTLPNLGALFVALDGKKVGFLRFRPYPMPEYPDAAVIDISINIAPEFRGKEVGKACLQKLTPLLKAKGVDAVVAEVKENNQASKAIFLQAGYEKISDKGNNQRYLLVLKDLKRKKVFIIAEAGSNWRVGTAQRDREMAKELINVPKEAGADAVKFQVFRPEQVYVSNAAKSDYLEKEGMEQSIYEIFADLAMPYEMIPELHQMCKKVGIEFMATPFSSQDFAAIDPFVSRHKIASYEISHIRLLELAARAKKPLILSTGAAVEGDIAWARETFFANGGKQMTLLQCTAAYPAPLSSCNLAVIPWLRDRFGVSSGLSDHSKDPVIAPSAAVALGASVIEKHYTLSKRLPGPDHCFAVEPEGLAQMCRAIRQTEKVLGSPYKQIDKVEEELACYARRGVQAIREIAVGDQLVEGHNMAILRPGKQALGCHPRHLENLEGTAAKYAVSLGEGLVAPE